MKLGERIRTARQALGLTKAEFARRVGIKQPSVNNLEDGDSKRPASTTLLRMRDLGINPDYVMHGRGPVLLARDASFDVPSTSSPEEEQLLRDFRQLAEDNKQRLLDLAKALRGPERKPEPDDGGHH